MKKALLTATAVLMMSGSSSAAIPAHQNITSYDGPSTCISCHEASAYNMLDSLHMQWSGPTPDLTNTNGEDLGKAVKGINSFCTYAMSSGGACFGCHVRSDGNAPHAPDVNDVDCLMCHNDTYAPQRTRLPDGSMGVAQPDDSLVQNVHRPTRANCLACHAKAGGGDKLAGRLFVDATGMAAALGTLGNDEIQARIFVIDAVFDPPGQGADQAAGIVDLLYDICRRCPQCVDDHPTFGAGQRLVYQHLRLQGGEAQADLAVVVRVLRNTVTEETRHQDRRHLRSLERPRHDHLASLRH